MKKIIILAVQILLAGGLTGFAQISTNSIHDELGQLVGAINAKTQAGAMPGDLTNELKQFDTILANHPGDQSEAAADVVFMKADLYLEVLKDYVNAQATFVRLNRDFPNSRHKAEAASVLAQLDPMVAMQKIRDSQVAGSALPAFDESDFNGKAFSLADHKGKVVLVDFWATWCIPCRLELRNVVAAYEKYHTQGFDVLGVNLDVKPDDLDKYLKKNDAVAWPQYFDTNLVNLTGKFPDQNLPFQNKLAVKYGIEKLPTTILLDGDGKIIAKDLRGDDLVDAVGKAVAANKK
ncbi:MAG TPA: TlpA disulfide reductase family protein [Verrucomicrobiae bacterium]|nr:TlpA disulfide reductase family protein [Verrucomicrobiae bacterium]